MEAAVLKPQMMADVRAEREVQKLQELVRKLERQNEQLRTRANIAPPSPCLRASSCCIPSPAPSLACLYFPPDDPFPYFQPHSVADEDDDEEDEEDGEPRALLDELMLLDLETLSPSGESEETWLYVSPGSRLRSGLSALQWCRHVLDQLETARVSLCQRLETVSRWRSGFSSPALPRARVVGVSPLLSSSPSCKPCAPLPSSTCERAGGRGVRRSVFAQASVDSDVSVCELDEGYKLQDLTDVQVMARLQEESLRQDFATSSSSSSNNRRSASFSFQFGQRSDSQLDEEEEDEDEDYGQLPPPQPRLSRAGALPHSHTFSSIRDWRRSSTSLSSAAQTHTHTPAQMPASETHGLRSSSDKLRRSMPNLLSAPLPSGPTPVSPSPSLRSSQSFDSSGALARLQTCSTSQTLHSFCVMCVSLIMCVLCSSGSRAAAGSRSERGKLLDPSAAQSHGLRQSHHQGSVSQCTVSVRQRDPSARESVRLSDPGPQWPPAARVLHSERLRLWPAQQTHGSGAQSADTSEEPGDAERAAGRELAGRLLLRVSSEAPVSSCWSGRLASSAESLCAHTPACTAHVITRD